MTVRITVVAVVVVACCVAIVSSAPGPEPTRGVVGIDLGSDFIKVGSPKGELGIDIVLNEQTNRKSPQYVGFRGDDRYLGEDAKNFAARFPDNMITMLNRLVGLSYDHPDRAWFQEEMLHSFTLLNNTKRGTIDVKIGGNPDTVYSVEELLGMIFAYVKDISEKDLGVRVPEAVVTVPHFFDSRQRQAIIDAGALGGIRVLALVHSTTSSALHFGIQNRGFGDKTVHVGIYDMGATHTEVGVFTFTPTVAPKKGKVKVSESLGTITVRAIVSDRTLGGRAFDTCIAKHLEDEFIEKTGGKYSRVMGGETLQHRKALVSLLRAAKKAKETLSANKVTPVTVEGMAPDYDFSTKITRVTLESKCAHLFDRVAGLASKAMEEAGIAKSDLHGFDLMGGGTRIPKIAEVLTDVVGRVDHTLNTDEAAALGATVYAAPLSNAFRVKGFGIVETLKANVTFGLSPRQSHPDETIAIRPLFIESKLASRKSITVGRKEDFEISLFSGEEPDPVLIVGVKGIMGNLRMVNYFESDGVTPSHENNTFAVRVEIRLSESGIIGVEKAEIVATYAVNTTRKVKVDVPEADAEAEGENAAASDTEAAVDDEDTKTKKKPKSVYQTETVLEMRKRTIPLTIETNYVGLPKPLDTAGAKESRAVLTKLAEADAEKHAIAAARNDLEEYILWAKSDGILENQALKEKGYLTEKVVTVVTNALATAQEWVEDGEGSKDGTKRSAFEAELKKLKRITKLIQDNKADRLNDPTRRAAKQGDGADQSEGDATAPAVDDEVAQDVEQQAEDEEVNTGSE